MRSFIRLPQGPRISSDTLKVVGYTFGRRPGPAEHIKQLRKSYGARAWVIRHLRRLDLEPGLLVRIYFSLIRPIFDYASPAYHTTLTDQQSESLERLQRSTLTIFGLNVSYAAALEKANLQTLKERREELFKNFTVKVFRSEKYRERWFTERANPVYGLRNERKLVQNYARCERLQRSPIYMMRQLVNELIRTGELEQEH